MDKKKKKGFVVEDLSGLVAGLYSKARKDSFSVPEEEILRRAEIVRNNRMNIALGAKPKDVYDWW